MLQIAVWTQNICRSTQISCQREEDTQGSAWSYLIDKLLLEGAVLAHVTNNLPDLRSLLNRLEGVMGADSLPNILNAHLQSQNLSDTCFRHCVWH